MSSGPVKNPTNSYTGNGSTLIFAITFPFLNTSDIVVSVNGSVVTTNFTVTGGNGGLGTLTFAGGHAPGNTYPVIISTIYSCDTSNAMKRRFIEEGTTIDGPMAKDPQGNTAFQNQQKRQVNRRTGAQALGVAPGVFPIA